MSGLVWNLTVMSRGSQLAIGRVLNRLYNQQPGFDSRQGLEEYFRSTTMHAPTINTHPMTILYINISLGLISFDSCAKTLRDECHARGPG